MKTQKTCCSLVVLAAGMGSRFGGGIKQLTPVGPFGEIIMDYSIHDAIEAGFNQIVFIIRKDIETAFRAVIGQRIEVICAQRGVSVAYAYQDRNDLPEGYLCPAERSKPWGTGHALLSCREIVHNPFVVINADDYYGKTVFQKLYDFLTDLPQDSCGQYCMAGFQLENTLSEHGGVTRGICQVNEQQQLIHVVETKNIIQTDDGAGVETENGLIPVDCHVSVSMNMWGFTPDIFSQLQRAFQVFLQENLNVPTAEFLIPIEMEKLLAVGTAEVNVLPTEERWFGVTYKEDTPFVQQSFEKLVEAGVYSEKLYE